ncbi:MAG: YebC/PmpR family DNA-binding transcriptional regulator [Proteobacteria bacterium]|nr:YebC/PmpR family DNA-binding transcriptional regulator [Pseudomonadota bacterium]
MSGHSKWSTIKHKKGAADAKRGKIFSKLVKEITVAAKVGGGDPNGNPRLRAAVVAARAENLPKTNIDNAIKRGSGEMEGVSYEEATFEGYGPGGAAVLVDVLTDNRKRSASDIRHIFTKAGGSLGEAGCVGWLFAKKGYLTVDHEAVKETGGEDRLIELALSANAEDVRNVPEDKLYEIYTNVSEYLAVKEILEREKIKVTLAQMAMVPSSTIRLEGKEAAQILRLMETLEDYEDVQNVYSNFDISTEEMAKFAAGE